MPYAKSPVYPRGKDRRSGLNRRWIRSPYKGEERRSGRERRVGLPLADPPVGEALDSKKMPGFEQLLVSGTIQLEAITRLLLEKGMINEEDLFKMVKKVQLEYRSHQEP